MKCTYRAARLLKENPKLKVHSVYRHTVNVIVKDRILAFHPDTIPSTPLSLALPFSEEEFRHFEQEAQRTGIVNLYLKSSDRCYWIRTGSFEKNTGRTILWEDRLDKSERIDSLKKWKKSGAAFEKVLFTLLPVLTQNYQLGGFSDCAATSEKRKDDSFITQILRKKTADILSKNMLEDYETEYEKDYEELICSLIGLGPGLTPSGDDFLTGMLFAFSLQKNIRDGNEAETAKKVKKEIKEINAIEQIEKKRKQICKVVSKHLDRTNDISREYLICAMENRFGELYHTIQEELAHGNIQQDIFCRIIHTGHSSGLDTLNGLAVGLKITRGTDR